MSILLMMAAGASELADCRVRYIPASTFNQTQAAPQRDQSNDQRRKAPVIPKTDKPAPRPCIIMASA